jgi:hypothetical protein
VREVEKTMGTMGSARRVISSARLQAATERLAMPVKKFRPVPPRDKSAHDTCECCVRWCALAQRLSAER